MSKSILENKELDLSGDDSAFIQEYLNKQDSEYLKEIENLIEGTEPIGEDIDVVIIVSACQEGGTIGKTLRSYANLDGKKKFEIVILENHPVGTERDNTAAEIERFRNEHPEIKVVHLYKKFEKKPTIGEVRKYLADLVLARKNKGSRKKSIVIASNDADLEDISANYVNQIAKIFEKNKKLDAIGEKWDPIIDDFKQIPLFRESQRLWNYFDVVFQNYYLKSPEFFGGNSAFRSGIYAAVGGYNKGAQLLEDLEMGWLIREARGYDSKPLKELLKEKRDFEEAEFIKEVQAIYNHYTQFKKSKNGSVGDKYIDNSFNFAMESLGIKYEIKEDIVVIKDISQLLKRLEEYRESSIN